MQEEMNVAMKKSDMFALIGKTHFGIRNVRRSEQTTSNLHKKKSTVNGDGRNVKNDSFN